MAHYADGTLAMSTYSEKRYLPPLLEAEPIRKREYLYAVVVLVLMAHVQTADYEVAKVNEQMTRESCVRVMTEAMNGGWIVWVDPHTNIYQASFCEVHETGVRLQ